jgi:hypothetical protein
MNNETQNKLVNIGKVILALFVTGILGVGFFCGGVIISFSGSSILMFIVWGIGILVWIGGMKAIFRKKKDDNAKGVAVETEDKYQKALVDYIIQAQESGLENQEISTNLLNTGWTNDDIVHAFDLLESKK